MIDNSSDDVAETSAGSALGWGAIAIGPDGVAQPVPEHEALAEAIPQWVGIPEHLDQAVRIYVEVLARPEASVRLAAVNAIGEVARRYGRVPHRDDARAAVMHATNDAAAEVREAAGAALRLIDRAGG